MPSPKQRTAAIASPACQHFKNKVCQTDFIDYNGLEVHSSLPSFV